MEQSSFNARGMKLQNKRIIMDSLRISPCSRAELARQTGLTRAAISVIVDNLLKEGLVAEGEPIEGKVGRKSFRITLNPDRYHMIGVTLERGCCCVGIAGFDGRIKQMERIEYDGRLGNIDHILEDMVRIILNYEEKSAGKGQLLGIGITAPGPLDLDKGQILNPPNFEGWENIYIVDYFKQRLAAPVVLENDINALASAERYYGIGKKYDSYLELQLDTGVGGGIILHGELYRGSAGMGNQVGHITINMFGDKCKCGNIGCAELYASIPRIVQCGLAVNPQFYSWKRMVNQAYNGDDQARKLIQMEAGYLSVVIVNVMNILDLDAVVLGGEAAYKGGLLGEMTESIVNSRVMGRDVHHIPVILSQMPEDGKMLAACNLIMESFIRTLL